MPFLFIAVLADAPRGRVTGPEESGERPTAAGVADPFRAALVRSDRPLTLVKLGNIG